MTMQEFIRDALAAGIIRADHATGLVYNARFRPDEPTGTLSTRGYLVATVHMDGGRRQVKLHQVVWLSAGRDIPSGLMVDHENRVKTDNRLSNLRLLDAMGNARNRRSYAGAENPAAKIDAELADVLRTFPLSLSKTAKRFGVSKSLVAQIRRNELWTNS